jgi:hypothetical protein
MALVKFCVASEAERRDSKIMGLNSSAFTVSKLVTVRRNHCSIVSPAMLAWRLSNNF